MDDIARIHIEALERRCLRLELESDGRLRALHNKSEELRREWTRSENMTTEIEALRAALRTASCAIQAAGSEHANPNTIERAAQAAWDAAQPSRTALDAGRKGE